MSGIIDSYKKVFENKQAHVWLAIVALIWGVTSTLLDIKLGNGDTPKNNIIDLIFSLLIGVYSLQFIHNAINNINNGLLPSIKEVQPKIIWGMIKLNIVWGIYAILVLILAFISYIINFVCSRLLYFLSLRRRFEYQRIIQHCTDFLIFQGSV